MTLGMLLLCAGTMVMAVESPTVTDMVDVGDSTPPGEQNVTLFEGAIQEKLSAEIGSLQPTWSTVTLPNQGAAMACSLRVPISGTSPILLEVEEIHLRREQSFGYLVVVNETPVYFRTYEEMGAGPVRYFIQVPRKLAPNGRLSIQFSNEGNAPLSISRVWAHGDFFALAAAEGTYETMPIYQEALTLMPVLAPKGDNVSWQDANKAQGTPLEDNAWKDLKSRIQGTGYGAGPFINLQYALLPFEEIKSTIDKGLDRVAKLGTPFQLAFNSGEWGSHPNGMDGLGGYFSDVTYSSIRYDTTSKTYGPCWPGTPGNTTWPAWNDAQLQRYLAHKLHQSVRYYLDRRDFLAAQGVNLPYPPIDQDWGLAASNDHSDSTIAAAKRDGVILTPENGLDDQEKLWKYRNMSQIPQRFGHVFAQAAQGSTIVIDRGQTRLPDRQTMDDYYFQTFSDAANSPFHDDRWAGWQFAVSDSTWATGEFLPHLPAAYFDYIRAQGKLTCPNLERMALPTLEYLQTCYERGFRGIWICNARSGDVDLFAPQGKGQDELPCSPITPAPTKLLHLNFRAMTSAGPTNSLISTRNIDNPPPGANPPIGALADGLQILDTAQPGIVQYRLEDGGRPLNPGLLLDLTAHFTSNKEHVVEIAVGPTADTLTTVAQLTSKDFPALKTYPWTRSAQINLGETLQGKISGILQITLITKDTGKGIIIDSLRTSQPWLPPSGSLCGERFTVKQMRTLNLWTQDRAVLERLQQRYLQRQGKDAAYRDSVVLATQGRINSAYRSLSGAFSQLLPARFSIRGHGQLGNLPVSVTLPNDDQTLLMNVTSLSNREFTFSVKSEIKQPFTISISGLAEGSAWSMTEIGLNSWSVTRADPDSGSVTHAVQGTVKIPMEAKVLDDRFYALPPRLSGSFVGNTSGGILIETQEKDLWLDNPIFIPVAPSTTYLRSASGPDAATSNQKPQGRDRVDLVLDTAGIAQQVRATFGKIQGTIAEFQAPVVKGTTNNGIITLTDGSRYEFANMWGFTQIDVPKLKPMVRFNTVAELTNGLTPGLKVEIAFCPYTVQDRLPRMLSIKSVRPPRDPNLGPAVLTAEGIHNEWFQNGWDSTIDPSSTTMAKTGTKSFAATITAVGGAAGFFHRESPFDCTSYRSLSFWINGGASGGQQLKMALYEGGQSYVLPSPLAANTWVQYTVKLSDIGAKDLDNLQALRFLDQNGTCIGKTFYIDDLAFIP